MMNIFIKKALSVFLATCTILPGTLCYAGNGKKQKKQHNTGRRREVAAAAAAAAEPGEEELQALWSEIRRLVAPAPARCKLKLSESLKSKCIPIKNTEHLEELFVDFFVNFIETNGSPKNMLDGTVLFLSIINHFEKDSIPNSEKNFYWAIAFLTLDMCTIRDRGAYDAWYNRLLWQYKLPSLGDVKRKFDSKESEKWHSNLRVVASDRYQIEPVIESMANFLHSKIGIDLGSILLPAKIYTQLSPWGIARSRANEAIDALSSMQSKDLVTNARRAFEECKQEYDNLQNTSHNKQLLQIAREEMETMQRKLDNVQLPTITSAQNELDLLPLARDAITKMLSAISPESIDHAEKTCEPFFKSINEPSENPILIITRGLAQSSSDTFASALKWAKDYLKYIRPCMEEADRCIQFHSKEFSAESLAKALEAQEKYRQVLDTCKPGISELGNMLMELGMDEGLTIERMMKQGFEDAEKHWQENQEEITKIQNAYEDKAISVVTDMLSKISHESVAAAEKAYGPFLKTGRQVEFFNAALEWAKNYLNFVNPCVEKADKCIRVLRGKFSEETLEAAKKAQKEFQQILSRYKPTSNDTDITQSFREIERHWNDNNITIHKIQEEQVRTAKKEQEQLEKQRMAEERAAAAESSKPSEIVFLHDPSISDPLAFLKGDPERIKEFNWWYDKVMEGNVTPDGTKGVIWHSDNPVYESYDIDLNAYQDTNGYPEVFKYKGRGELRNTDEGFRIVYYKEQVTNRIVILYVGEPFGKKGTKKRKGHGNPWKTLIITPSWKYDSVAKLSI